MNTQRVLAAILLPATLSLSVGCASTRLDVDDEPRPTLTVGERVRISKRPKSARFGDPIVGSVAELRNDTLALRTEKPRGTLLVSLTSLKKLEVYQGTRSNTGRGAGIGFLMGALVGASVGFAMGDDPPCVPQGLFGCMMDFRFRKEEKAAGLGIAGALGGALIGTIVGAATRTDRWEEIPLDELRIQPSPVAPDGVGLSASLRL